MLALHERGVRTPPVVHADAPCAGCVRTGWNERMARELAEYRQRHGLA